MTPTRSAARGLSPYRGFLPFRYADAEWFFGRKSEIQALTAKAVLYRVVLLFGESGAGKSSLLNAGLWPALRKEGFQPERLRVRPVAEEPILIERIEAPEESSGYLPTIFDRQQSRAEIPCSLREFSQCIERATAADETPVLVFDQFEEMFTVVEPASRTLRNRLLATILDLIGSPELKVKVILSMREDFLGHLEVVAKDYPQIFERRVRLSQLARGAAERAIRGPFEHPAEWPTEISAGAAEAILDDFQQGDDDARIHATHLQIVCSRLWQLYANQHEITADHYHDAGGVQGLLEGFLQSELEQLPREDRTRAYRLLGELVTASGTRDVVSEERLLRQLGEGASEWFRTVMELLEHRYLVNRIAQRDTYYVEIASEYLIGPVTRFNREAERDAAAREAAEEVTAREEERARQKELQQATLLAAEQAKRSRQGWTLAGFLALALLAAVALWWRANGLLRTTAEAQDQAVAANKDADYRRLLAESANRELKKKTDELNLNVDKLKRETSLKEQAIQGLRREQLRTQRLHSIENSVRLSYQSDIEGRSDPNLGGRLAIEALLHDHSPQTDRAARQGITRLRTFLGSAAPVRPVQRVVCPDGDCAILAAPGEASVALQLLSAPGTKFLFSPDGRYSALASGRSVVVWLTPAGRQVGTFATNTGFRSLRFSADGEYLGTMEAHGEIVVRNISSGKDLYRFSAMLPMRLIGLSSGGQFAAIETATGIQVWDGARRKLVRQLDSVAASSLFAVSPNGQRVFFTTIGGYTLRDMTTGRVLLGDASFQLAQAAAFSPDSEFLATINFRNQLTIWDLSSLRAVALLELPGADSARPGVAAALPKPALAFSSNGEFVATTTGRVTEAFTYRTTDLVRELCSLIDRPLSREEWAKYLTAETERFRDPCLSMH